MRRIGVWNSFNEGKVFISSDYDRFSSFIFCLTLNDFRPNTMMLNQLKKYNFWKVFVENFQMGNVYFENQKIKHNCYEIFKMAVK